MDQPFGGKSTDDAPAPRAATSERERIELLGAILGSEQRVGIGDDAAVLDDGLVLTVDVVVEGVHFERGWLGLDDLGYKATMGAASDLAAMGASPTAVLASLVLPGWLDDAGLELVARGQAEACAQLGTHVVGGNLSRGGELSIATTVVGRLGNGPLTRGGARSGDELWLAGPVGLAAAGLAALWRGEAGGDELAPALRAWRRPRALIEAGRSAARMGGRAAIDISDGLAIDAAAVAKASGVDVVLQSARIVGTELRAAAARVALDPTELALYGGEDYALLVAAPAGCALPGFTVVGYCEATGGEPGLWLVDGERRALEVRGYDHFDR